MATPQLELLMETGQRDLSALAGLERILEMMNMGPIDLNDEVVCELTEYGKRVYVAWCETFKPLPEIYINAVQKAGAPEYKTRLWELLQIFGGDNIGMHLEKPFNNLRIVK